MEWLFIIGLGVVFIVLLQRVQRLEFRLRALENFLEREAADRTPSAEEPAETPTPSTPLPEEQPEPAERMSPGVSFAAEAPPALSEEIAREPETTAPAEPVTEPEPVPEPEAAGERVEEAAEAELQSRGYRLRKFDFEDMFGRRLPIWAGGIALAVAGVFLVIYSIEQGLMTPPVRVAMSFLFGLVLLGGAEAAYRFEERVADPRVRQALSGAGLATLYAGFYLAGAQYGLIGPAFSFAGLALVTALALGLSFRFGLPAAVLGLLGGFATPVLVASDEANVPVLAFYLALLTAGLSLTARRLGYHWLGAAALVGGFAWGGLMLLGRPGEAGELIAIGLYLLALGAAIPLLAGSGTGIPFTRLVSGGLASLQMAVLVDLAGYDLLTWGLYLLLAAAVAVLSWKADELRPANALVAAVGLILLALWPDPSAGDYALIAAPLALVVLGLPLFRLWRECANIAELLQLTIAVLGFGAAAYWQFGSGDNAIFEPELAAVMAALSAVAALAVWRLWRAEALGEYLAVPLASAAILAFAALNLLLPGWVEVTGAVAVALVLAELQRRRRMTSVNVLVWLAGLTTFPALFADPGIGDEVLLMIGDEFGDTELAISLIRWGSATLPFLALAWLERTGPRARLAEVLLGLVTYGLIAQFVPGEWLAWAVAALALACLLWQRQAAGFWGTILVIGMAWGAEPVVDWTVEGVAALSGEPMLASSLADWDNVLRYLLPTALAFCLAAWREFERRLAGQLLIFAAGFASLITIHILFKQVFFIANGDDFLRLGLAERSLWQGLLILGGVALARMSTLPRWQRLATALGALGLAHFIVFGFVLHNPLWDAQAVGSWPVANLLVPSYALAGIGVWWHAGRLSEIQRARLRPLADGALMLLVSFLALSLLRQFHAGSVLTAPPITQSEDLLRSLLGIVLALGFLFWGSRTGQRSWRIGSLVLMLLAVLKVFLVDAAGLEGLLRIASFLALGISLIGIGWVYSRQLSTRTPERAEDTPPA